MAIARSKELKLEAKSFDENSKFSVISEEYTIPGNKPKIITAFDIQLHEHFQP